jgi:hypothetical protein
MLKLNFGGMITGKGSRSTPKKTLPHATLFTISHIRNITEGNYVLLFPHSFHNFLRFSADRELA